MWACGSSSTFLASALGIRKIRTQGRSAVYTLEASITDCHDSESSGPRKVVVVGTGWAGLGAAHHLCKQGFEVTVIGGHGGSSVSSEDSIFDPFDASLVHAFRQPSRNIFTLCDELEIQPFTNLMTSAVYSSESLEAKFPIFQDVPRLPSPLGTFVYPEFLNLSFFDRLTLLPLISAVIDFDNTDRAWRKYDSLTARELFRQVGCSEKLYRAVINPMIQVGLFALGEQCSAAALLGMMYYFMLAHQQDFDVVWCSGSIGEKIFRPWMAFMEEKGCQFLKNRRITDFSLNEETGKISELICGDETFLVDAIILAVGVTELQHIIAASTLLQSRKEFLDVYNLRAVDVIAVRLWFDRKVKILRAGNIYSGVDDSAGWAFFDLNSLHEEYKEEAGSVIEVNIYHANQFLHLQDEQVLAKVRSVLSSCIEGVEGAAVVKHLVLRCPETATLFFPGSYKFMMRGSTSFPNLFMAGDWIVNRHGSWSQEKAYVTGLEAANSVVDHLGEGEFAKIIAVEEDEPHIEALRSLNRNVNDIRSQVPSFDYLL
ncbi:Phytoene dehydrogenase [Nymphaea thermarum]|nr:Phytoene dehydrogenase [Nymphaea thermarum]